MSRYCGWPKKGVFGRKFLQSMHNKTRFEKNRDVDFAWKRGMMMQALHKTLNQQLANFSVLYFKLYHYHWFVKGEKFFELHAKFEEFYKEAASYIDEIAERILAIQGIPLSTMKEYLDHATIQEAVGNETAEQMVEQLIQDFQVIVDEAKKGIQEAERAEDDSSADLFIGIRTNLEKHIWMLTSYLAK
jgi:starvation-inducible DNA-binding protein